MNRCRGKFQGFSSVFRQVALAGGVVLVLAGCGEGPNNPTPPYSPPRPVTEAGQVSRAHLVLPALPVTPKPGMM